LPAAASPFGAPALGAGAGEVVAGAVVVGAGEVVVGAGAAAAPAFWFTARPSTELGSGVVVPS